MKLVELTRTCEACPAQWAGKAEDGQYVYIRYRWGTFGLALGETPEQAVRNPYSFTYEGGTPFDGYMTEYEMRAILRHRGVTLADGLVPDPCNVDHNGPEMRGNCIVCGAAPGPEAEQMIKERHEALLVMLEKMKEERSGGTSESNQ